jgi:hypothetical protein
VWPKASDWRVVGYSASEMRAAGFSFAESTK